MSARGWTRVNKKPAAAEAATGKVLSAWCPRERAIRCSASDSVVLSHRIDLSTAVAFASRNLPGCRFEGGKRGATQLRVRRSKPRCPGLGLLQREGDLLFGVPALLHGSAPPLRGSRNRKTRTHAGPKRWGDVKASFMKSPHPKILPR